MLRVVGMVATVLLAAAPLASAQTYPTRDMKVVIGLPAGSGGDIVVRYYADKLAKISGRAVIIENKPGMIFPLERMRSGRRRLTATPSSSRR